MRMDDSWYMDWVQDGGNAQEQALLYRMCDLGPLFEDMLFERGTTSYDLIKCQSATLGTEDWVDDEVSRPPELEYFTYFWFHPRVEELEDGLYGYFSGSEQEICISSKCLNDEHTLLHEMIHLHEFVINEQPMYFHDMLYWALYRDVRKRIPKLDEIIDGHAHMLTGSTLFADGGLHDILFLLKSFDLDMKKGCPLGTVFGYGRDNEFKSYRYK